MEFNLGFQLRDFKIISITGKTKKNKSYQKTIWTLRPLAGGFGGDKEIIVYTGYYDKYISYPNSNKEIKIQEFPFMLYDKWKNDQKAEIGKVFSNPKVKATYSVVDVFLKVIRQESDYKEHVVKMYRVENSNTKETFEYEASYADKDCFSEDLSGRYCSTLSKVEKPSNPSIKYGKTNTIAASSGKGVTKFSYVDNVIDIVIFGDSEQFSFILKNLSENSIKLIWDDAVFVGINGSTSKIMHSGVKYSQREASQPASTIIRGASLDDIACPIENVYYSDVLNSWEVKSMYPKGITNDTKQIQLMLPIQIKDVVNEYIFVFDVKYQYNHPERLNL